MSPRNTHFVSLAFAFLSLGSVVVFPARMACAASLNTELVVNGNAETGNTSGWTMVDDFITVSTNTHYAGSYAFWGAGGAYFKRMRQSFDISAYAPSIDAGVLVYDLRAALCNPAGATRSRCACRFWTPARA